MSTAVEKRPVVVPEERFWKRYSPHYELPLASMTSIFLHGLVLGTLILGGIAFLFKPLLETRRPPNMDMVELAGLAGDGKEEGGGTIGTPSGVENSATENIVPQPKTETLPQPIQPNSKIDVNIAELSIPPMLELGPPIEAADLSKDFQALAEASKRLEEAMQNKQGQASTAKPSPGPKGTYGKGKVGDGIGSGNKKGPNVGIGGMIGKNTKQEIYAWRWRFDLTGNGKEHADKLAAIGVTIAFPSVGKTNQYLVVTDLNRRPAPIQKDSLIKFKDAVKWFNTRPESIRELATELRIPFVPAEIVLLLPKEREEKMAEAEARFAQETRRDLKKVTGTWFDFRLQGGNFEPVVLKME